MELKVGIEAIQRLGQILSLLETHPDGLSLGQLSKFCGVLPEVIEGDLKNLEYWGVPLYTREDGGDDAETRWALVPEARGYAWPPLRFTQEEADAFLDAFRDVSDPALRSAFERAFSALSPVTSGSVEGCSSSSRPSDRDSGRAAVGDIRSPADAIGAGPRLAAVPGLRDEGNNRYRLVKGLRAFYTSPSVEACVRRFEKACHLGHYVRMTYRPRNNAAGGDEVVSSVIIQPLCVVFESDRGIWYLVGRYVEKGSQPLSGVVDGQVVLFSSDRTGEVEILPTTFKRPSFDMGEYFSSAWGVNAEEEPVEVRVRFYDDFNVIEKVANRAASRPGARLERESERTYIYTDLVAGLDEFRRWLRAFGSSAEALEPPELRHAMRRTAEALISLYEGKGRPWDATN